MLAAKKGENGLEERPANQTPDDCMQKRGKALKNEPGRGWNRQQGESPGGYV